MPTLGPRGEAREAGLGPEGVNPLVKKGVRREKTSRGKINGGPMELF